MGIAMLHPSYKSALSHFAAKVRYTKSSPV